MGKRKRILDTRPFSSRAEGYFGASVGGPTHVGLWAGPQAKPDSARENALATKMVKLHVKNALTTDGCRINVYSC